MNAYITKNSLRVTQQTLNVFKSYVFSVPFDSFGDKRKKPYYYSSIAMFLQHLICSATVSKGTKKRARFKGDNEWTYSVPFPFSLGLNIVPAVFKRNKKLHFSRALENLADCKIIKVVRHDSINHKCREYCLSKKFLKELFTVSQVDYLKRNDRYYYLTDIYEKGKFMCLDDLMLASSLKKGKVNNDTSRRSIPDKEFRCFVSQVYNNLDSLYVNLDLLMDFCNKNPSIKNRSYYFNFISHLYDVGIELISHDPFIICYKQSYKTAKLGGRSFEIGTGFQYLPSKMKWRFLAHGYNYDIKGCQYEILKKELEKYNITRENINLLDDDSICSSLKIKKDNVKKFRFAVIFSAGDINVSPKSNIVKSLADLKGKEMAIKIINRWIIKLSPLKDDLDKLIGKYLLMGKNTRYGLRVKNAVGQEFNCTYKDVTRKIKWRKNVMHRKLLAHMIQGIESKAVYDYVAINDGVCALEHDGFVSLNKLNEGQWNHPYLKIALKNSV